MSTLIPAPVNVFVTNITNGSVIINSNLIFIVQVSASDLENILLSSFPSSELGSIINTSLSG
jgi:hypothetical protein